MKTYALKKVDKPTVKRINELLHILVPKSPEVEQERLNALLADKNFKLFVTEISSGEIAGMLSLTTCNTLASNKHWIEDVVVDEAFRGQGIGRKLLKAAVDYVKSTETEVKIFLTSNPSRVAARSLYFSEGFEEYETGVFRFLQ